MNFTEFKNELNLDLGKLNIFLEEEQINQPDSSHKIDPDEFVLYKKYLS